MSAFSFDKIARKGEIPHQRGIYAAAHDWIQFELENFRFIPLSFLILKNKIRCLLLFLKSLIFDSSYAMVTPQLLETLK